MWGALRRVMASSSALDSSWSRCRLCSTEHKSGRPDRWLFDRSSAALFSQASTHRGRESGCFFMWIVSVRVGYGEMLVSLCFSHLLDSFLAWNYFLHSSEIHLRMTQITLKWRTVKCCGLPLPEQCMHQLQSLPFRMTFLPKDYPWANLPCMFTHE